MSLKLKLLPALAVMATVALAMHITYRADVLAWSSDGLSALVEFSADGPEGGGSSGYGVMTCAGVQGRVTVSSDFSPGGPSTPQTISAQACREAVKKLGEALKVSGFKNVTVDPSSCARERGGLVRVNEEPKPNDALSVAQQDGGITVSEGGRGLAAGEAGPGHQQLAESPSMGRASLRTQRRRARPRVSAWVLRRAW